MHRNEIVLITAYTPTTDKLDNLRDLIKKIKSFGYEICLITHTSTPQDIIDRCEYFIFDSFNEVNRDRDISYWSTFHTGDNVENGFEILYKSYNLMATHIIPIFRLMSGGLSYLNALSYDKVYMMEYDSIVNNDHVFKIMSKDLDQFDLSTFYSDSLENKNKFAFGPLIGLRLSKIDLKQFYISEKGLIDLYREYFYTGIRRMITESILFDKVWSNYSIKWNPIEVLNDNIEYNTSASSNSSVNNSYVFYSSDEDLNFFCHNQSDIEWNFDVLINNMNYNIVVQPKCWLLTTICKVTNVSSIKIFINNEFNYKLILPDKNKVEYLNEWVTIQKKN